MNGGCSACCTASAACTNSHNTNNKENLSFTFIAVAFSWSGGSGGSCAPVNINPFAFGTQVNQQRRITSWIQHLINAIETKPTKVEKKRDKRLFGVRLLTFFFFFSFRYVHLCPASCLACALSVPFFYWRTLLFFPLYTNLSARVLSPLSFLLLILRSFTHQNWRFSSSFFFFLFLSFLFRPFFFFLLTHSADSCTPCYNSFFFFVQRVSVCRSLLAFYCQTIHTNGAFLFPSPFPLFFYIDVVFIYISDSPFPFSTLLRLLFVFYNLLVTFAFFFLSLSLIATKLVTLIWVTF